MKNLKPQPLVSDTGPKAIYHDPFTNRSVCKSYISSRPAGFTDSLSVNSLLVHLQTNLSVNGTGATMCPFTDTFVCKWHRFNLSSKPSLEITAQACLRGYCALEIAVEHTFEATVRSNSLRKRLAKRHCRLHGSTVSAKSEN